MTCLELTCSNPLEAGLQLSKCDALPERILPSVLYAASHCHLRRSESHVLEAVPVPRRKTKGPTLLGGLIALRCHTNFKVISDFGLQHSRVITIFGEGVLARQIIKEK